VSPKKQPSADYPSSPDIGGADALPAIGEGTGAGAVIVEEMAAASFRIVPSGRVVLLLGADHTGELQAARGSGGETAHPVRRTV
jgi:hypothetical protein